MPQIDKFLEIKRFFYENLCKRDSIEYENFFFWPK